MPGNTVYISIGSNIHPERFVPKAIELLKNNPHLDAFQVSSFYKSKALERPDQTPYSNGVARFQTTLDPLTLKTEVLRKIEYQCGRVREEDRFAPRTIDLDIILFGDLQIDDETMTIPDPAIWEHAFVTIPLLQLEPSPIIPERCAPIPCIEPDLLPEDTTLNDILREGKAHG